MKESHSSFGMVAGSRMNGILNGTLVELIDTQPATIKRAISKVSGKPHTLQGWDESEPQRGI